MCVAEGVGFEPTFPFGIPVFKTGALSRSATPPVAVAVSETRSPSNPRLYCNPTALGPVSERRHAAEAAATLRRLCHLRAE